MKYPMQVLSRPNRTLKSYDAKGISKFSRHTGKCIQGSVRSSRGKTYIEVTVVKSLTVSSEQPIVQPQTVQDVCLGPVTRASANRKDWYRNCLSSLLLYLNPVFLLSLVLSAFKLRVSQSLLLSVAATLLLLSFLVSTLMLILIYLYLLL